MSYPEYILFQCVSCSFVFRVSDWHCTDGDTEIHCPICSSYKFMVFYKEADEE